MNNFKKTGVYNQIHESYIYKYDKIDSEMMTQWIKDFKQGMIDTVLMGDYKKEMAMNRLELEIRELRERTGDNYMLNKMVNTDGVEFFAEYTLYKDYNKYFGLTLSGTSINIVDIIEAEFAEFLSYYRMQPKDSWHITPEENKSIKRQLEESKLAKFSPMYDEDDIEDEIKVDGEYDMNKSGVNVDHGSDLDIDKPYVNIPSMWTETSTNTGEMTKNSWTETHANTSGVRAGMWKSNQPIEDRSKAELVSKIVADVMEELLTKGSCSLNITLNQD